MKTSKRIEQRVDQYLQDDPSRRIVHGWLILDCTTWTLRVAQDFDEEKAYRCLERRWKIIRPLQSNLASVQDRLEAMIATVRTHYTQTNCTGTLEGRLDSDAITALDAIGDLLQEVKQGYLQTQQPRIETGSTL